MSAFVWRKIGGSGRCPAPDRQVLEAFCRKWEYRNVNAVRQVLPVLRNRVVWNSPVNLLGCFDGETLAGFFVEGPGGLGLPLFSPDCDPRMTEIFAAFPERRNYPSLMGPRPAVLALEALRKERRTGIDYHLMSWPGLGSGKPAAAGTGGMPDVLGSDSGDQFAGFTIRKAEPRDAERLFPLQRDYELEEVVLDPVRFNPTLCLRHLRQILKTEYVLALYEDGVPVAKAGTNAGGLGYCQLGGVYTRPDRRNRGLSRLLIRRLQEDLGKRGKNLCLFVKKENLPAVKVYQNCGFRVEGDFRISYCQIF